jgi:hypothetical protein
MERSGRILPAGCDSIGLDRDQRDITCLFRDFGQRSVFPSDQIKLCNPKQVILVLPPFDLIFSIPRAVFQASGVGFAAVR